MGHEIGVNHQCPWDIEPKLPKEDVERKWSKGSFVGLGLVLLKLLKSGKFLFAIASLAAYSLTMTWQIAVVFMLGLVCHEYGHVWAMRRCGIPTKGFYLIPFVGGICSPERPFRHRQEEAFIAAMGPIFGLAATPLCLLAGLAVDVGNMPAAAGAATLGIFVNLFNLLPIVPMDGGRILRAVASSLNRTAGLLMIACGIVLSLYLTWELRAPILALVAFLGFGEIMAERRRGTSISAMDSSSAMIWIMAYVSLVAVSVSLILLFSNLSGDNQLIKAIMEI